MKLLSLESTILDNDAKFLMENVFNSDNDKTLFCLGKFIQKCFKLRS